MMWGPGPVTDDIHWSLAEMLGPGDKISSLTKLFIHLTFRLELYQVENLGYCRRLILFLDQKMTLSLSGLLVQ